MGDSFEITLGEIIAYVTGAAILCAIFGCFCCYDKATAKPQPQPKPMEPAMDITLRRAFPYAFPDTRPTAPDSGNDDSRSASVQLSANAAVISSNIESSHRSIV